MWNRSSHVFIRSPKYAFFFFCFFFFCFVFVFCCCFFFVVVVFFLFCFFVVFFLEGGVVGRGCCCCCFVCVCVFFFFFFFFFFVCLFVFCGSGTFQQDKMAESKPREGLIRIHQKYLDKLSSDISLNCNQTERKL